MTAAEGTTMTVQAMGRMLGLKKTESYYLLHKHHFETVTINHQLRVVRANFEEWYEHQDRYRKVDGNPPGSALQTQFYSVAEIRAMLAVSDDTARELIERHKLPMMMVAQKLRVPKAIFDHWYETQNRYRNAEDRERDKKALEASMTVPEMGRLLGLDRRAAWALYNRERDHLEMIRVAERPRITKRSFEKWYAYQDEYRLLSEQDAAETDAIESMQHEQDDGKPVCKDFVSVDDAADFLGMNRRQVYHLIESEQLDAKKTGRKLLVRFTDLQAVVKEESEDGKYCSA